jgi:hypothetical protein
MKIEITYDSGLKRVYEMRLDPRADFEEHPTWQITTKDPESGDEVLTAKILSPAKLPTQLQAYANLQAHECRTNSDQVGRVRCTDE